MRFPLVNSSSELQLLSMEYYVGANACDHVCNQNAQWVCHLGVSISEMILHKVLINECSNSMPELPVCV